MRRPEIFVTRGLSDPGAYFVFLCYGYNYTEEIGIRLINGEIHRFSGTGPSLGVEQRREVIRIITTRYGTETKDNKPGAGHGKSEKVTG